MTELMSTVWQPTDKVLSSLVHVSQSHTTTYLQWLWWSNSLVVWMLLYTMFIQPNFSHKTLVAALTLVHIFPCSQAGDLSRVKVGLVWVCHHVVLVQVGPTHVQLATQLAWCEGTGWFRWMKVRRIGVVDNIVTVEPDMTRTRLGADPAQDGGGLDNFIRNR